ncbi:MAG: hypothetical protein AB7K24_05750 [Gemmataceae bacterium]
MSDVYRYRHGDTFPVSPSFKSGTPIELGDLVYLDVADASKVKPAGSFAWDTDLATTQRQFARVCAGVAAQRYDGDNDDACGIQDGKLRIDSEGIFEFDCAEASFKVGDLVGPAKQSGNALEPQKIVAVASADLAIGRVVEEGASVTRIKVRILPTLSRVSAPGELGSLTFTGATGTNAIRIPDNQADALSVAIDGGNDLLVLDSTDSNEKVRLAPASGQKIGLFGATPVVQQATTGTTTGFTAGSGTAAKDDSTFTGGVGAAAYTVGDVVLALKNLGVLAQ